MTEGRDGDDVRSTVVVIVVVVVVVDVETIVETVVAGCVIVAFWIKRS